MPSRQRSLGVDTIHPVAPPPARTTFDPPATAPRAASREVQSAREALYAAQGAVLVTEARLREALEAAPRVSPRMSAAETGTEKARRAAIEAAQAVVYCRRVLADAEGDLEVAEAMLEDMDSGEKECSTGQRVAAQVRMAKRTRAVDAAAGRLVDAEEAHAAAESRLAVAEEHQSIVAQAAPVEPIEVVRARVAHDSALRQLENARDSLDALEQTEDATGTEVPVYASLDAFVEGYLLPQWRHRLSSSTHWCGYWWRHAEAVSRLEALWEAWEVMRREPAPSLSTWWRDHLDPHMRALTDAEGTFYRCSADVHEPVHEQSLTWTAHSAPDAMFATNPEAPEQPARVRTAAMSSATLQEA